MNNEHGMVARVPRWRMVVETGHGWEELTDEEKRLAREYLCTDQTPAILAQFRAIGENLGRQARERIDVAVMEALRSQN